MNTWNILILDKSGSMLENKTQLIEGFNEMVNEQQNENPDNFLTVITFNDKVDIFKEDLFKNINSIKNDDILTYGKTALYDAVGKAYDMIINNKDYTNVSITIITDGLENSSRFYTVEMLNENKKIIDEKYSMKILFIGADETCITCNKIISHANYNVNCSGDMRKALRVTSRSMSGREVDIAYLQEESNISPVVPNVNVMERSMSGSLARPPKLRRVNTVIN